jgi:hypothetical protein
VFGFRTGIFSPEMYDPFWQIKERAQATPGRDRQSFQCEYISRRYRIFSFAEG